MPARNPRLLALFAGLFSFAILSFPTFANAQSAIGGIQLTGPSGVPSQPVNPTSIAPITPVDDQPVDGLCGTAQNESIVSMPIDGLCRFGSSSAVNWDGSHWSWSCFGYRGGRSSSCWANRPVNGTCGAANGQQFSSAPGTDLCSSGTATSVNGSGPWSWSCTGRNGGTDAGCSALADPVVVAVCGGANGSQLSSKPTGNLLCSSGTPSGVSGSGPWTWSCSGTDDSVACSTSASFRNGVCGSASGMIGNVPPTGNLCSSGTASAVTGNGPWSWTCSGTGGGAAAQCRVSTTFDPSNPSGSGYHLTFSDEFDGLNASAPPANGKKWETNFWYRGLLQSNYSWLPLDPAVCGLGLSPFSINNGVLSIETATTPSVLRQCGVTYPYTSGHLDTFNSFSQTYGYFETRARVSNVFGTIFAFWLLPADGSWPPEIDAPEIMGRYPGQVYVTNHTNDGGSNTQYQFRPQLGDLASDFHTYGVLWTKDTITWYVDSKQIGQTQTRSDEHKPFFMILEFGVGGCGDNWAGCPSASSFSYTADVDYVRAWSAN